MQNIIPIVSSGEVEYVREDLTGRRYGRLTVCWEIKQAEKSLPPLLAVPVRLRERKNRGGVPSENRAYEKLRVLSEGASVQSADRSDRASVRAFESA